MVDNKIFAERIRNLRIDKKMTQQELANIVGLTSTGVSYWESGKAIPNFETMTKLSNYFGVSIDYLTGKKELENKGMYSIIDSTIDIFLQEQEDNDKKN